MNNFLSSFYVGISVLIALICHEVSHGYVSYLLGDPTPKQDGRLSLNPLKHLDPIGTFCLLVFHFGWAKPVIINPDYYKNMKLDTALVSLAGPLVNFILGIFCSIIMRITGYNEFIMTFIYINIAFCALNIIPIPPLDGSKILAMILPKDIYLKYMKIELFGFYIIMILLFTNILGYILSPIYNFLLKPVFLISGIV